MPKTPTPKIENGLHPVLLRRLALVHAAMAAAGMPMRITDGVRSAEEQHALWQIGREKPGSIVTNADGTTTLSNHQLKADGYGHAADCCFQSPPAPHPYEVPDAWWDAYGALCRAVGLRWGIKLSATVVDRPHAELHPQS